MEVGEVASAAKERRRGRRARAAAAKCVCVRVCVSLMEVDIDVAAKNCAARPARAAARPGRLRHARARARAVRGCARARATRRRRRAGALWRSRRISCRAREWVPCRPVRTSARVSAIARETFLQPPCSREGSRNRVSMTEVSCDSTRMTATNAEIPSKKGFSKVRRGEEGAIASCSCACACLAIAIAVRNLFS